MTHQAFKVPTKKNGQPLSNKQMQEIANQNEATKVIREHTDKVNGLIQKYAEETIYEGRLPNHFSGWMKQSFAHFSDLLLKMPYEQYRGIALVDNGKYTLNQLNSAMQVLGMTSATYMNMSLKEYIAFKDELQVIMGELGKTIDDMKQRIKDENPLPATN